MVQPRFRIHTTGFWNRDGAAIAGVILAIDPNSDQVKNKVISMLTTADSKGHADVHAILGVLRSIKPQYWGNEVVLHIPDGYANTILNRVDDKWVTKPKKNVKLIEELRGLIEKFSDLTIMPLSMTHENMRECAKIAKAVVDGTKGT